MSTRNSSQHKSRKGRNTKQAERAALWEQRNSKEGFEGKQTESEDGWIWNIKPGKGMSVSELKKWLEEGELYVYYAPD